MEAPLDLRVLVVAPTGRDAELLTHVLAEGGFHAWPCPTITAACAEAERGAAALLLAEEAVGPAELDTLDHCLDDQPEWSDIPVLILVAGGRETVESEARARDRAKLHHKNLTLLERPIRMATLISSIEAALRARRRQYELRANLEQRATAQEAVRRSEKLAVAGRLAASIAHEINNPLESVTNLLYLISASSDLNEIKMFARTAEQELARVSEITTQTLRFHRQQTNAVELCLGDVIESVLALFHARLMGAHIRVCCDFRTSEKILVFAGEIRQVIANLIQNALDAMHHGGTLHLRILPIRRHGHLGTRGIRILIGDSGTGIPKRIRNTLFEPFVTTKGATGTGLGLWVSKEIVEKHKGELRFRTSESAAHHGTVFSIFLPSQRAEIAQPRHLDRVAS
ncbi:MAG: ATP-binding protein [Acidobacteriota bacterium]|nr:ATP-binding protein [Acidobacteriota bacterium]